MPAKHTYLRTHKLSGAALSFAMPAEEPAVREKALASKAGRAAKTLVKEGRLRLTVVSLRKGVVLQQHQVEGALSIQVLRGRLRVAAEGASTPLHREDLAAGSVLVLQEQAPHTAEALADCSFLLTVAMPTSD